MQMSTQQWDFISAEGRLCAKCLRSGDTGSTSAISVSRVRKEELSNKVAAVLLENARLQWFQFQPILVRFQACSLLPQHVLQNQKKELLTYCSPCCVCYIAALLGGRILRIRNIAEGRLCAKCLRSGDTGSTSAISVSRVRKEELSDKVAAVLLENARLQWFQFQPILVRFQACSLLPQHVLQNSKKELLTYCSPCCVCYIAALLGGRILRIRNIAEGRLCAKCLRSGDTGSTSAISVSRVRKEELSNKVAAVLLENARLQWFQFQPILVRFQACSLLPQLVLQNQKKNS